MDCPGLSILVHAPSKAGKSYLADTAPGPRLFLDSEGNSRFLRSRKVVWENTFQPPPEYDGTWDTCIVFVRDFTALTQAYQWLGAGKHQFRSVIIDSLTDVQQRCVDMIAGVEAMRIQDYGELARKVSSQVRQYRDLLVHPTNPLDCVVYTCMTKVSQEGTHYPYVQGQLATTLPYYVDLVTYLKAQYEEDGTSKRYLLTKPRIGFEAGDRTDFFPAVIENPRIDEMLESFCKELTQYQGE